MSTNAVGRHAYGRRCAITWIHRTMILRHLYQKVNSLPYIKKAFVGSGVEV
ncbi:MAG: hypothetical protein MZV63_02050 [Marinilabiliales bacterium]|nr:hypothetical protein [Marinilabiliales bacterium]